MYRGQETHPIRINARYEMNWANSYFKKFRKPDFRPNIWPPEGQNKARNTKMNRVQEIHTIRVNAGYGINRANSFFQKVPETLSTDRRTDGRTGIGVNPVYPHSTFGGAEVLLFIKTAERRDICDHLRFHESPGRYHFKVASHLTTLLPSSTNRSLPQ